MLAGYASASWSKTKIMGTFGGINIGPGVTDFMDGFIAGMNYWNEQKGDTVAHARRPDPNDPNSGTFTGNFESTDNAKNVTIGFLQEGADVVLPVGGPIGGGAFAAIQEQNADAVGLGVDADWYLTTPPVRPADPHCSVMKRIDNSVFQAMQRAVNGDGSAADRPQQPRERRRGPGTVPRLRQPDLAGHQGRARRAEPRDHRRRHLAV